MGTSRTTPKQVTGYRPPVYACEGVMLGIRQPLDGPVFQNLEDAEHWCLSARIVHNDRRLVTSDGLIEPFKGLVDCGLLPDPAMVRVISRICKQVAEEIQ